MKQCIYTCNTCGVTAQKPLGWWFIASPDQELWHISNAFTQRPANAYDFCSIKCKKEWEHEHEHLFRHG